MILLGDLFLVVMDRGGIYGAYFDKPEPPQPRLPDPGILENPRIPPPSRRSTA